MRYLKLSKRSKKFFALLFCILIFSSFASTSISGNLTQNPKWETEVGDSQTYIYTKFYDNSNENPNEHSYTIINDKDEERTVVFKVGLTVKYEIKYLEVDIARGVITYGGTVTSNESTISTSFGGNWQGIIRQTIANKTYWEIWCSYQGFSNVTGDLIIEEIVTDSHHSIHKWNWVTGWTTYRYWKSWNETTIIVESEVILIPNKPSSPDYFIFGIFLLGGISTLLIILNVYKKRK